MAMLAEPLKAAQVAPGRGLVEGLANPRPFGTELPSLLQEDDFCIRLTKALDDVVAPVFATLDCWDSYLDPLLAPDDFVDWLASWVGLELDETWPLERRRRLIGQIVEIYRMRGTSAGLAAHVGLYAEVQPEIQENGGCLWSQSANTPLPGSPDPHVTVRVSVPNPDAIRRLTLDRIVSASRPAHLSYSLEIATATGRVISEPEAEVDSGADDSAPGAVDLPGSERVDLAPVGPESEDREDGAGPEAPTGEEPSQ